MLFSALLRDLPPARRVHYSCGDDDGGWGPAFSFVTPPAVDDTSNETLVISAIADVGHTGGAVLVRDEMLRHALDSDLMLQMGDIA